MLSAAGGFVATPPTGPVEMPDSVRLMIERNLSRLSSPCRELLAFASLSGQEFRVDVLTRASGLAPERALKLLDEAEAAGVTGPVSGEPDRSRFAHALFAETLAESLGAAARAAGHRRVAELLANEPRAEEYAAEIAHHWWQAGPLGDPHQAIAWACRAADHAMRSYASEEAVRLYRIALRALNWSPTAQEERRAEVLLGLGEALRRTGDPTQAKEIFLECTALARKLESPDLLTRAALGFAPQVVYAVQPEPDTTVVRLLEEAIAAWGGHDSGLHACALAQLALALIFGDEERRSELRDDSVAMARRVGDSTTLRYVLARWLASMPSRRDPKERLAIATELVQLAEVAGDLEALAVGRRWRSVHLLETGDAPGMRREQAAFAQVAAQLRQPVWSWYARVSEMATAVLDGRLGDAERSIAEGYQLAASVMPYAARTYFVCALMIVRVHQGRIGEFVSEFRAIFEAHPTPVTLTPLVRVESERKNAAAVRRIVERATIDDFAMVRSDVQSAVAMCFLAEACAFLGDETRAARLYELMTPLAWQWVVWGEAMPLGPAAHFVGLLARTLGRLDEAAGLFEDALASSTRAGAPMFLALTEYEYARLLRSRRAPGDAERALELLRDARGIAESIGLEGLKAKIAALDAPTPRSLVLASPHIFRRDGDFWTIAFADRVVRMRDMRGLHYLAQLLRNPGLEFHANDLVALCSGKAPAAERHAERARVAVTKAIKAALDKIAANHEPLGAHLAATIRRGYFCAYVPDPRHPIVWDC